MCHLLETIKLKDGILHNLKYHNLRFNRARHELFNISKETDLEKLIHIPEQFQQGLFRCRVVYSTEIEKIEFIPHQLRTFKSLKMVFDNEIDYGYKYTNREKLNDLFSKREECDEIIIVKNGIITDCSIGNLIFFDAQKWWTPSTPLLNGTRRMQLLDDQLISEEKITPDDLSTFTKAAIINVFYGLENLSEIPISSIKR